MFVSGTTWKRTDRRVDRAPAEERTHVLHPSSALLVHLPLFVAVVVVVRARICVMAVCDARALKM